MHEQSLIRLSVLATAYLQKEVLMEPPQNRAALTAGAPERASAQRTFTTASRERLQEPQQ